MPKPVIKWVGGKTQLLPEVLKYLPKTSEGTYFEPFIGGGAVFWNVRDRFKNCVINDWNWELVTTYQVLQDFPEDLIKKLREFELNYSKTEFLRLRDLDPSQLCLVMRAARMVALNKWCFTPGSQVLFEDESWRPIEEVRVGNRLWNGRIVHEVLSRKYEGTVRRIKVQGSPYTMSVTEDHPVLAVQGKGVAKQETRSVKDLEAEMNLRPAKDLSVGDYVFLPTSGTTLQEVDWEMFWPAAEDFGPQAISRTLSSEVSDHDVCRLLGYYAAEGHIEYNVSALPNQRGRIKSVTWTFNADETDTYVADVVDICTRLFGLAPLVKTRKESKQEISVQLNSVYAAKFIQTLVPGQSWAKAETQRKTKRLHQNLMTLPIPLQLELLKGWIRGDGGIKNREKGNNTELSGTCTVLPMARQLYRLAQRCGLKPSWRLSYPAGNETANIYFSGNDVEKLGFPILQRKRGSCNQRRAVGGYLAVRIKEITDLAYSGLVYNLEVDGDHLICVDNVVSHNCFNGLYRVNKSGKFNVPFGSHSKPPTLCDVENFLACSKALKDVEILQGDFEAAVATAVKGDVVYFDPPYVPLNPTSDFTSYTSVGFGLKDQQRLASCVRGLHDRGVSVILSNSYTPTVLELYKGFSIFEVQARRSVNSKGDKRGKISEALVVTSPQPLNLNLPDGWIGNGPNPYDPD